MPPIPFSGEELLTLSLFQSWCAYHCLL